MSRTPKPPTPRQARWLRWHRRVIVVLFVAAVLCGVFVSLGLAALLLLAMLGIATFATGSPTDSGSAVPPIRFNG